MSALDQYRLSREVSRGQQTARRIVGKIGNSDNDVYLSGTNNYVWVTIDGVEQVVFNRRVFPFLGAPVVVGVDKDINPNLVQVLDYNYGAHGENFPAGGGLPKHGDTHEFYALDPAPVNTRQIQWLAAYVTGNFEVTIRKGPVPAGSGIAWLAETAVDLTSHKPATAGLRYVLIYTDSAGALQTLDGTIKTPLALSDIPTVPSGGFGLWAVRLYSTQTKIADTKTASDLIDLRFISGGGYASSGNATSLQGVPVSGETPHAGDVLFYDGVNWNPGTIITHEHVYQEDLSALCNNSTQHFATAQKFEANSTQVYLNGLLQDITNNYDTGDYSEDADLQSITFVTAPLSSDSLFISYIVSINAVGS